MTTEEEKVKEGKGRFIVCEVCGKIVFKTNYQYNRNQHHYCSQKCAHEGTKKNGRENRICEFCGETFNVRKSDPKRFCSRECQNKWQKTNTGSKNPKFKGKTIQCDWCGKWFDMGKYNLEYYQHHFCSKKCRKAWHANVFSQDPEWKDESRKRATKMLPNMKERTETKPQLIVNDILNDLGINFVNEQNFVYYSIDNYLTDYDLVIEVMGDFWHCSPLVYKEGAINEIQKRRIPKDKAKRAYLRNNYDIEILYLWESDVYNNTDMCKALIKKYIENKGDLENYNSFNYHLGNNKLILNKNIIYPYFEIKTA